MGTMPLSLLHPRQDQPEVGDKEVNSDPLSKPLPVVLALYIRWVGFTSSQQIHIMLSFRHAA